MGLGRTGLDNFTPKGSGTATSVLSILPPETRKKTTTLQLRINEDDLLIFQELCARNKTDVSKALRAHISASVAAERLESKSAFSDLSVQNVRTNENGSVQKCSQALAASGEINLRNKEERECWLNAFRKWGIWLDVPEVNKTFYRYEFKNGCAIVVEVGIEYWDAYSTERGKPHERVSYSIIDAEHISFNSQGDSFTGVIQWLTKFAKEI